MIRSGLLLLCSLICFTAANARQRADTTDTGFVYRIRKEAAGDALQSKNKYREERIATRQRELVNQIGAIAVAVKLYLKDAPDSLSVMHALATDRKYLAIAKDGLTGDNAAIPTQRNLAVSAELLRQLIKTSNTRKHRVDSYIDGLTHYRNTIDSLYSDTLLYALPPDSAGIVRYAKRIIFISKETSHIDTLMTASLATMENVQFQVDALAYQLHTIFEEVEAGRERLSSVMTERELDDLSVHNRSSRQFADIVKFSVAKEKLAWLFYVKDNLWSLLVLLLLIGLSVWFIRSLKKRLAEKSEEGLQQMHEIIKRPLPAAIIIVLSTLQFFFIDAPFIFRFSVWLVSAVALAFIFKGYVARYWMFFWIGIVSLFALACIDNFVLQPSWGERWVMLAISLLGACYAGIALMSGRLHTLREKHIVYAIVFLLVVELAASFFNFYGRYNLGKVLMVAGYTGVVIGILFLWAVRLINEGLRLAALIYKEPERHFFYINFDKVGERAPALLYVLLVIGWFVLVGRNFYAFRQVSEPFMAFLRRPRTLGDYTFTVNGLFFFMLITFCSLLLSRFINYFAYEPSTNTSRGTASKRKLTVGSWILLIRIFIVSVGLFLAVAAAGIPLDKLTIVLGALGVGIGLGLQSLVSNLVSGLVIAFEKPVNVGDLIDVGGKLGTMRSIGFRSSVVQLVDGASLVIPNGDLLSEQLINWTMSKNLRRIHIGVGVAYGSDLKKVQEILMGVISVDNRIFETPAPMVVAKGFGDSSINFEMIFWVKNINESFDVTSDMITTVDAAFKAAGIVIPFPQRDVHMF